MFWIKCFLKLTPEILVKFCTPSELRPWRTGMLLLIKSKGHTSNSHYSGFPNHLQTKSLNLTCIFLSTRARYFLSKPNGWPCTRSRSWRLNTRSTSQACWKQGGRGGHMPLNPYYLPCQIFGLHIITLSPRFSDLGTCLPFTVHRCFLPCF